MAGKPMIVWTAERAMQILADDILVAVDDEEVLSVVKEHGIEGVLTSKSHPSGSDRVMEVARVKHWRGDDIVINVQGDEPLLSAEIVNDLVELMRRDKTIEFATVSEPISLTEDFKNPNCVKVVTDDNGVALYFSRAPIPYPRDEEERIFDDLGKGKNSEFDHTVKRHVGIYGFRLAALEEFVALKQSSLERVEKLEQLRWLQAGRDIHVIHSAVALPGGVDTPEDLIRVEALLLGDQE
jgi:3-deoxy-manno-octulosonate cytidylyltransferase (CMP-KDO synthetase)